MSRPPSGARTAGAVDPDRAVEVALRLLELGVEEVCFGDTIGVGVPSQVGELTGSGGRCGDPPRADRVPLPRHPRHRACQRRRRARRPGFAASTRRPAAPVAVPTRRARPATSPRRTSCTSSTASGCEHGVRARGRPRSRPIHRRRPRSAPREQGRPGRRLGPARRAADGRARDVKPFGCVLLPSRADGRRGARTEPELRAAQRLQPAASFPARVRREGRSDRVRPPGDPDAADVLPRAVGRSASSTRSGGRGRGSSSRGARSSRATGTPASTAAGRPTT